MIFARLHAIVIPLVLVGLLGLCFVKMQQAADGAVRALRDTLLVEPSGEQSDPPHMTYQQLRRIMASTKYYRVGFFGGAFLLLAYMIIMAGRPASKAEQPAFKTERPVPKTERPAPQQVRPRLSEATRQPPQSVSAGSRIPERRPSPEPCF